MDLAWLEDFLKLAEEGNFSRAAEARNLSQPAFSRRIKAVEDWVGATLIDRDTHRIALTEAGEAFRSVAEEVAQRLALGRTQAREIDAGQSGMIRFAATQTLAITFFPEWLRRADTRSELGSISLIADTMAACERLMLEGRADFLLCHEHPAAASRLDAGLFRSLPLGKDLLVPVSIADSGSPRFALPGDPSAPLPFLAFDERSGMGRILDAVGIATASKASLRMVFQSHLANGLLSMAREGRGIAWAPVSLCNDDLESGRLVRAGDATWEVPIEIRLLRPKARRNSAVEEFWTHIAGVVHQDPP